MSDSHEVRLLHTYVSLPSFLFLDSVISVAPSYGSAQGRCTNLSKICAGSSDGSPVVRQLRCSSFFATRVA